MIRHTLHRLDLAIRRRVTLADFADQIADLWGARRVATDAGTGEELSYRQAAERVAKWSNAIAEQIEPGQPVVLATANSYDQFLLCLAVSRAGGLAAPVNRQMRAAEIDHVTDVGYTAVDCASRIGFCEYVDLVTRTNRYAANKFHFYGLLGQKMGE